MVFDGAMVDREAFVNALPYWVYAPSPASWVDEADMTEDEKIEAPTFHTCGGYLRNNNWTAEWAKAFASASAEDVQKVRDLPGFDVKVFEKITGLNLALPADNATQYGRPTVIEIDGVRYIRENS
jgi:hypothetical protein